MLIKKVLKYFAISLVLTASLIVIPILLAMTGKLNFLQGFLTLIAMYFGFGVLIVIYRVVRKFD